jgi:glycosyltransferase involved in cell wall biosynthesis
VWPKQESTSELDAAACGLPLILSDRVQVRERIEGNGLTYKEGDVSNLAEQIATLADLNLRQRLGDRGRKKMQEQFSWDRIARERLQDYEAALKR